jgi:DNA-binding GntR family transcriptional regulator
MIAALEARDPERLAAILGHHLTLARERVKDGLPA